MKIPLPFRFLMEVNFAGIIVLGIFVLIGMIARSAFHWLAR